MKILATAFAATLLAGTAFAQTAAPTTPSTAPTTPGTMAAPGTMTTAPGAMPARPTPGNTAPGATSVAPMTGVNPNTGVTPSTGMVDRNTGTAAASGDRNQAVATTSANAPQPARGRNSFTMGEARRRLERGGFQQVTGLKKDNMGVWRGSAMRDGASMPVWLDYKGNMSPAGAR